MEMKKWLLESRPQFLMLAVVLVLHGSALTYWQGAFSWVRFLLALAGLMLMHGSVNMLNDWHDYQKSGIDKVIRQTPFSGGSGQLPRGEMTPREALIEGIVWLSMGAAIGFYLAWDLFRQQPGGGWPLLAIGLAGVFIIAIYTPVALRIGIGEVLAGAGLGLMPVLGVYYLHTLGLNAAAWWSALPSFFLTYNLLFLNEFPDWQADKAGNRKHVVILLGPKTARWWYIVIELAAFGAIVVGVVLGVLTPWALLGLGGLVPAVQAIRGALANYDRFEELFPAMGANVMAVLATNALLAVGYLVAALLG
ncbi:MAG: prenyltransferase [Coriobacteriia bacterium]|nr:prenyltransferase [Coriobacteriia bacterium]